MRTKLSFTLDADIIEAVRRFAEGDSRPISNALDLLLKEALTARGVPISTDIKPAGKKARPQKS